jgi:hypothetical protein
VNKLSIALVGILSLGTASAAFAQAPMPAPAPQPAPAPDAAPPSASPPMMAQPEPPPMVPAPPPAQLDDDVRPNELVFGIGLGYVLPTSLETPNITSVRARFPSGIIIEPRLTLADSSSSANSGQAGEMDTGTSTFELGVAALVRYPMVKHGKFDFELVGDLGVDSTTTDPDGDNNNTTVTTFELGWGVAVEYWIARHWQFSLTATNPLFSVTHQDMQGMPNDATQTTTSFGVVFAPTVAMMIHVYN